MDNFKAVYRILPALEKAMDLPGFDVQQIGHEALGVTQERWCRYMEMMADVGYITGVEIQRFITGETSVDARDIIGVCIDGGNRRGRRDQSFHNTLRRHRNACRSSNPRKEQINVELWRYNGKKVRLTDINGKVWIGFAYDYTSALDNPDGVPCISIRSVEFEEGDISTIEVLEE